jgi:hypothetical protein
MKCVHRLELPGHVVRMGGARTVENLLEGKPCGGREEKRKT